MDEVIQARLDAIDSEDRRQNKRIDALEAELKDLRAIASSIRELTLEIKHLREDVQAQSARLDKLENVPIERMNNARTATVNSVINIIVGTIVGGALMMIIQHLQ